MHGDDINMAKTPSKIGGDDDQASRRSKDLMSVAHSNKSQAKSRTNSIAGSSIHQRIASQMVASPRDMDERRSRASKSSFKNNEILQNHVNHTRRRDIMETSAYSKALR